MSDAESVKRDPIMAEVRQAREALAMRFGGDLRRIADFLNAQARQEGRHVVSYPPRRSASDSTRAA